MPELNRTEGNWRRGGGSVFVDSPETKIICRQIENRADEILITAAPDLLEFAQEMVKRYPNSPWITDQANKAINKALNL
ncbi:hypothetical protein EZY14_002815 [Kordia sp. TARA_039_SRF]|nr:hypothetical protein EZY14_002815 [Kordia sp. TARA_039_SRF]